MYLINLLARLFTNDAPVNDPQDSLPRECWLNIHEYLQKDEDINALRLVSTQMLHLTTLSDAGKNYYCQKDSCLNKYDKAKGISKNDNNYARFFNVNLKAQITTLSDQFATTSNKFGLITYYDNSLQLNEEKAYLAQQLATFNGGLLSSQIHSISNYNSPTDYFHRKKNGLSFSSIGKDVEYILKNMDSDLELYSPTCNHVILIFTIDASETNRFIKLLVEKKNKYHSKMPFFFVISLNPLTTIDDFDYPILKLVSISAGYLENFSNVFFLNDSHPDLWTNTCHRYDYYYHAKMGKIIKEMHNSLDNLVTIKESLQENSDNQLINSP